MFDDNIVRIALAEDRGSLGDVASEAIFSPSERSSFRVLSKERGDFVLCGIPYAMAAIKTLDENIEIEFVSDDARIIDFGDIILSGVATTRAILRAERVMLNFLQHMSGVSTYVARCVTALDGGHVRLLDTRKTIPGLRYAQKYAVKVGGGHNHRLNLSDLIMIKDNHIAAAGGIREAVRKVRSYAPHYLQLEVECSTIDEVCVAVSDDIDIIMLDNMTIEQINECSKIIRREGIAKIEVSGGISLENIHLYKALDIDFISVGALTHSVRAVDISLDILPQ